MSVATYHASMTEQQLLEAVTELALRLGWLVYHVNDSRRDVAGFPDLVLVPPESWPGSSRLTGTEDAVSLPALRTMGGMFVELKTAKGRVRPEQQTWLERLRKAGSKTAIWRPADWHSGTIEAVLKGEQAA